MEELIKFTGEVGFPICITMFLLVRFDKRFGELTDSIKELTNTLEVKMLNK